MRRPLIALVLVFGVCVPCSAQVVVEMPAPPSAPQARADSTNAPSVRNVSLAGYLGRTGPFATYGSWPRAYRGYGYAPYYSYYGYPFGYYPWWGFPCFGVVHSDRHHGRSFHSGSGAILGHFSKHGSNLTVNFRFPP